MFKDINEKKQLLDTRRPLPEHTVKSIREHLEVINHRDAILFVEEIVKNNEPLTEWQIKNIHRLVLKGIDDIYAGTYRDQQVMIAGAKHMPPEPFLIKEQMENLIRL